jgi:hypothetical protein
VAQSTAEYPRAMTEAQRAEIGVCVVCAKPGATGSISIKSEQRSDRAYRFFIHLECLKKVAKPGFAGLKDI